MKKFLMLLVGLSSVVASAQVLTDAQKSEMLAVLSSQNQWNQLVKYEMAKRGGGAPSSGFSILDLPVQNPVPDPAVTYQPIDNNCQFNIVSPEQKGNLQTPDGQKSVPKFSLTIQGSTCPVFVSVSVDGVQTADGFDGKFVLQGSVLSDELKKQMDIDQSLVEMDFSVHQQKQGTDQNAPIQTSLTLTGKGDAHSQKFGKVAQSFGMGGTITITPPPVSNQMPVISMSMKESSGLSFADFSANLHSEVNFENLLGGGTSTQHFFINDGEVTKDEYMKYRNELQTPLDSGSGSTPPPAAPMSCEVTVYDAKVAPIASLKQAVQAGQPLLSVPSLLDQKSCGKTLAWTVTNGPDMLMVILSFNPHDVELSFMQGQSTIPGLAFLLDQSTDQADQIGNFTYRMACVPVPKCQ